MIFRPSARIRVETERLVLRPPEHRDWREWSELRASSEAFLKPWEPVWASDHLSRRAFSGRVHWARRAIGQGSALPLLVHRKGGGIVGAVTLDNVRRGPAQAASMGYWLGEAETGKGYMTEALPAVVHYAFREMDLSRIEAATLEENRPSRRLLARIGFREEGVAQAYLQIAGRWRAHILHARLRPDRVGRAV